MKDLVFVDVETTGLDPDHHELIEVAAVRVHPHTLEPLDHLSLRVVPDRLGDADPRACEVALANYSGFFGPFITD